ncbi:uncharacterized protein LOC142319299 isoform X2 [Lycorma delicatula]|uniref:uncharacterized protein LOC142319299 isoform X2 n=1 Tax=Lycorma delicatula TaxID=130591 RepID=UPI003F511240
MFIGKLTKSHRSWKDNNNSKNNINDYYNRRPIRTLGSMFQESGRGKDIVNENEINAKNESQDKNESSRISTVAEIHKYESKKRKSEKKNGDNDTETLNEKNTTNNGIQEEKLDHQKPEMSKFRRKTLKLTKMFAPGSKESQENIINNKDVEKADTTATPSKKVKQSKTSNEDKESEISRIEEISEDSSFHKMSKNSYQNNRQRTHKPIKNESTNEPYKSVGVQATPFPPFRLYFLPEKDWKETDSKLHKVLKIILSQCGLACIVLSWAMMGALVFRLTEGPQEQRQVLEMAKQQSSLVIGLATDLRQVVPQEPIWRQTIERYADRHEALILSAVSSGYPQRGTIWTYPGSLLFATSLLTTLVKTRGEPDHVSEWPEELFVSDRLTPPPWLKYFPFVAIPTYYLTGFLLFGVARGKQFPEVFLFPLDFTAAGGVASTYGPLRIAYAMYLEGAVILASTNVALLRVSATRGFTTAAIKLGLMTNSLR